MLLGLLCSIWVGLKLHPSSIARVYAMLHKSPDRVWVNICCAGIYDAEGAASSAAVVGAPLLSWLH